MGQLLKRQGHEEAEEQEVLQQASVVEARRRQEAASQRTTTAGEVPADPSKLLGSPARVMDILWSMGQSLPARLLQA